MLEISTSVGYEATTVEMVCERAGVEEAEFEAQFESLEDCALQLLDSFFEPAKERFEAVFKAEGLWPDSLRAASYEVCDWIVEHPREVRFGGVELLKVGEMGPVRYEEAFKTFIPMVEAGREVSEDPDAIPELMGDRAMGSMAGMLTKRLREGPVEPHQYVPQLLCLAVLPYLGQETAMKELSIPPPERPVQNEEPGA